MDKEFKEIEYWLVANVHLTRSTAHQILGLPHYIETDRFVTQQGLEDHWVFADTNSHSIRIVYREHSETLDVFSNPPDLKFAKERFGSLFQDHPFKVIDPPVRR